MTGPAYRTAAALERLGLRPAEPIRFKRGGRGRYVIGKVEGVEHDGAVTLRDPDGSARTLRPERVEIRRPGPKGRLRWQLVSDVAITWEQLELFERPPSAPAPTGRRVHITRDHPTLFDDLPD